MSFHFVEVDTIMLVHGTIFISSLLHALELIVLYVFDSIFAARRYKKRKERTLIYWRDTIVCVLSFP